VGDSHARGIAAELLHQSNHSIIPTGQVKPNSNLSELIRTVKEVSDKVTKRDTLILIGGSNDIGTNFCDWNLTSIVNLLQNTQHTNINLAEIPVRYDVGARRHINEEIKWFNRNLQKIAKGYQHVSLIRGPHSRDLFTRHGLHRNSKGKEQLATELLKILTDKSTALTPRSTDNIQLPKKVDTSTMDTQHDKKDNTSITDTQNSKRKDSGSTQASTTTSLSTLSSNGQVIINTDTDGHTTGPADQTIGKSQSNASETTCQDNSPTNEQINIGATTSSEITCQDTSSTTEQGKTQHSKKDDTPITDTQNSKMEDSKSTQTSTTSSLSTISSNGQVTINADTDGHMTGPADHTIGKSQSSTSETTGQDNSSTTEQRNIGASTSSYAIAIPNSSAAAMRTESTSLQSNIDSTSTTMPNSSSDAYQKEAGQRNSNCIKQLPVTRSKDFLY
jgi:hypothetical protein